jgi:sortase A
MNGWVVRQVIRAAGEILLTAGVVGLLFLGYLVWGTGLRAASAQRALSGELNQEWQRGASGATPSVPAPNGSTSPPGSPSPLSGSRHSASSGGTP